MEDKLERKDYEIQVKVRNEEELYNRFDETKNTLSDEVISYIEENLNKKRILVNLIIKIKSDNFIDEKQIEKAFKVYIDNKIELNQRHKRFNRLRQIRLFVIGLIFISISIIIGTILNSVLYTIISTVGSFAIWEASNIWIVENMESKIEKRILQSLLKAKIEII